MTHIIPKEVRLNTFDKETFTKIKGLLQNIPSQFYYAKNTTKIMQLITLLSKWSKQQMMWVVSVDPAYFLQYKKNSSALFVIDGVTVIAYRPKYLEYPQIVDFPVFDQSECPVKVELVNKGPSTSEALVQSIQSFVERMYAKSYQSSRAADFQTELVKNVKYYLSKVAAAMYWHVIFGPAKTQLYRWEQMDSCMKFRINQNKYLYAFSLKGVNDPIKNMLTNKWKELISFVLLFILLISVVACPNSNSADPVSAYSFDSPIKAGFCSHRTEIYYGIGGFFFLMTGMKIANRKKPPKLVKRQ